MIYGHMTFEKLQKLIERVSYYCLRFPENVRIERTGDVSRTYLYFDKQPGDGAHYILMYTDTADGNVEFMTCEHPGYQRPFETHLGYHRTSKALDDFEQAMKTKEENDAA